MWVSQCNTLGPLLLLYVNDLHNVLNKAVCILFTNNTNISIKHKYYYHNYYTIKFLIEFFLACIVMYLTLYFAIHQ